jgi:hypothetical protein
MLSNQEFTALLIELPVRIGVAQLSGLRVGSGDWLMRGMHHCNSAGGSLS